VAITWYVPAASTGLMIAAPPLTVAVPRVVVPEVNVTVPVGAVVPELTLIVAVIATASPAMPGFGVATSVVVVGVSVTTWFSAGADAAAPLFASPA
jgi:hypothetical protein